LWLLLAVRRGRFGGLKIIMSWPLLKDLSAAIY
jgi:hypothetical protein